jgi:putative DNA methylase
MIPKECKRLAEVDFPIAVVSKHAVSENSVRRGHPKTLHLWWARRPLAACRAILLALLWPDPCDENCPEDFKQKARELLVAPFAVRSIKNDHDLRQALLKFIGDFANWDLATDGAYLDVARKLVKAVHADDAPLIVDPFSGGGSIPLEALRLQCEAFAGELNPVAGLILKTTVEDIQRQGFRITEDLRNVGLQVKDLLNTELDAFYPDEPDRSKQIAYLWARTVRCEAPNCGAEIPLIKSLWLRNKGKDKRALKARIELSKTDCPGVFFEIFSPKTNDEVAVGTVNDAKATCLACRQSLAPERVRAQLLQQRGGADVIFDKNGSRIGGARLIAIVTLKPGQLKREYRLSKVSDYEPVWRATQFLLELQDMRLSNGLHAIPDEPIVQERVSRNSPFRMHLYGCATFGDLFTARQKVAIFLTQEFIRNHVKDQTLAALATLSMGKSIRHWNAFAKWHRGSETVAGTFALQAISMAWDFPEMNPTSGYAGDFNETLSDAILATNHICSFMSGSGQSQLSDATHNPLPDDVADCWFTDPPYYDAVPYADLADVFYVWHRRTIPDHPLFRNRLDRSQLTPKDAEIVEDENKFVNGQPKDGHFYENRMAMAFKEGSRVLSSGGVGCIVFAHKSTEGWEALMSGAIRGGWTITASWPLATERGARLRARESAALASSVHLICRPRIDEQIGDWQNVIHELPKRVGVWMERLQSEGIRGADLVFACIGPALEIYSRYKKVVDAQEREIPLGGDPEAKEAHKRGYLAYVWEVVGRTALEQVLGTAEARARNGAAGALEEDARLTALFLWTLQSTNGDESEKRPDRAKGDEAVAAEDDDDEPTSKKKKGFTLIYDVARRFAQPLGIHLEDWEDRIIETKKGVVRLVPVSERGKQLFGEDGMQTIATELERGSKESLQMSLYADLKESETPKVRGRRGRAKAADQSSDRKMQTRWQPTTLDRVHAAMLLQASGRANALRALLESEQERGPDFLRLANALSALYPKDAEEKRLLDAMLLAVPR